MSSPLLHGLGNSEELAPQCSRAGCRAEATYELGWRNPKIHSADRRKIWLACDEHVEFLSTYLSTRGFPLEVVPFSGTPGGER